MEEKHPGGWVYMCFPGYFFQIDIIKEGKNGEENNPHVAVAVFGIFRNIFLWM